jgi:hypothetical protein
VANRQEFSALRWTTALPGCDHWRHDVKAVLTMAHDVFISYARARTNPKPMPPRPRHRSRQQTSGYI